MTQSGKSLFYFGVYGVFAGLLLITIPETLLSLVHLPALPLGWARIIGLLAMVIGTYDIVCGKANIQPFIKASVYVRFGFFIGTIFLVLLQQMPKTAILFGVVDAGGALWTVMALKSDTSKN